MAICISMVLKMIKPEINNVICGITLNRRLYPLVVMHWNSRKSSIQILKPFNQGTSKPMTVDENIKRWLND